MAVKAGFLLTPPGHIFFDFNVGLRLRVIDYNAAQLPQGASDVRSENDFFSPSEDEGTIPGIVLGIRVGYRFR